MRVTCTTDALCSLRHLIISYFSLIERFVRRAVPDVAAIGLATSSSDDDDAEGEDTTSTRSSQTKTPMVTSIRAAPASNEQKERTNQVWKRPYPGPACVRQQFGTSGECAKAPLARHVRLARQLVTEPTVLTLLTLLTRGVGRSKSLIYKNVLPFMY